MSFGVAFQHFRVVVAVDHHRTGTSCGHCFRGLHGDQSGQLGIRIGGHEQSRVGAGRQAKPVFNLLNCTFVRLAGAALQIAKSHDADTGRGGELC